MIRGIEGAMKILVCVVVALVRACTFAQGIEVTIDGAGVFNKQTVIKQGTFGDEEFSIILTAAKNGVFTVSGYRIQTGAKRPISGNMSKSGVLRATMKTSKTRQVAVDGRYDSGMDAIVVTSIDGKAENIELARFGQKLIKPGPYHGRSIEPDLAWELTVTRTSGPDFSVQGIVRAGSKTNLVEGTLRKSGKLLAQGVDNELLKVDGAYDFEEHQLDVVLRVSGAGEGISAVLTAGKLPVERIFGLVSKVVGNVPGPSELNDYKIAGSVSESNFTLDIVMKPPYQGEANITFDYSSQLTSSLTVGKVVELTVMASASKSGRDAPNLAGSGFWYVEGDGAEVLEMTKAFVGTASDGKFYPSVQGVTKFKVRSSGTIKITAVYTGQYWGPGGAYNWNPCTYTYKFGERPTVEKD